MEVILNLVKQRIEEIKNSRLTTKQDYNKLKKLYDAAKKKDLAEELEFESLTNFLEENEVLEENDGS